MGSSNEEEYTSFLEKVKRTIYVDNLSPLVTEAVVKAAFNQFGNVKNIHFIPNYLEQKCMPQAVLVEMGNKNQAQKIILEMADYPFMISGMPRPVRACAAKIEMFDDCPRKPGRKIECYWLDPKDPDFEVAKKIKQLVREQAAQSSFLLDQQLAAEEKLHAQQSETLKAHYKKFELIDKVYEDGSAKQLAGHYDMRISDP